MPPANFLTQIIERRRPVAAHERALLDVDTLRCEAGEARRQKASRRLCNALRLSDGINVIAEIKRASPSKGVIRENVAAADLARAYAAGGAIAVSVLTEEDFFRGSLADLKGVRSAVELPVLRKDFIFDEFQIYEAALAGADALLLIAAALDDEQLTRLRVVTEDELGMDALIEVHTGAEMRRAQDSGATLIGVNNRDLQTFAVSLETSLQLARFASRETTLVSESGLSRSDELHRLRAVGYKGFLIGETLMRAADPQAALRQLISDAECAHVAQARQRS